jgi:hypothetical protein
MSTAPKSLRAARRCNARTRTGQRCRSPAAHGGPRCWAHARGFGPVGEQNGAYRHGRRTQEAKALRRMVRGWAREGELLTSASLRAFGGKPKRKWTRRSDVEVEQKLVAMFKSGQVDEAFSKVSELRAEAAAKPSSERRSRDEP